jgi:predicted tellurium resistance membrane protein TerC
MRRYFFEILAVLLMGGSIVFFVECIDYLSRRDYVAAVILMFIGFAVISVGKEMARLALVQKE